MKSQNVSVSWKLRDCITQMGRLKPRNREVAARFPTTVKWGAWARTQVSWLEARSWRERVHS